MRFVAVVSLMLIATPALADQVQAPAAAATPATSAASAKPKLICETQESIGTRLGSHKVCMTAEQWHQQRSDAGDFAQRAQSATYANKGN